MKILSFSMLVYLIFLSPTLVLCQYQEKKICLNDLLSMYYSTFASYHLEYKGEYYFVQENIDSFYCDTTKKSCFFNLHYYSTDSSFFSHLKQKKLEKKEEIILLVPIIHFCSTDSLNVEIILASGTYKQYKPLSPHRKKHTLFLGSAGNMYFDLKYNFEKECWDIINYDSK